MKRKLETRSVKDEVLDAIQRMPDDCTLEDIQYHLYVAEKLRRRIAQADAGEAVPHAEAQRRLEKWIIK